MLTGESFRLLWIERSSAKFSKYFHCKKSPYLPSHQVLFMIKCFMYSLQTFCHMKGVVSYSDLRDANKDGFQWGVLKNLSRNNNTVWLLQLSEKSSRLTLWTVNKRTNSVWFSYDGYKFTPLHIKLSHPSIYIRFLSLHTLISMFIVVLLRWAYLSLLLNISINFLTFSQLHQLT